MGDFFLELCPFGKVKDQILQFSIFVIKKLHAAGNKKGLTHIENEFSLKVWYPWWTKGVGAKPKINVFKNIVTLHIKSLGMKRRKTCNDKNKFPFTDPYSWVKKSTIENVQVNCYVATKTRGDLYI